MEISEPKAEPKLGRRPVVFRAGPRMCVVRAINAAFGEVRLTDALYKEYQAVFAAEMEEEARRGNASLSPAQCVAITNAAIDTIGFGGSVNTITYMVHDLAPGRFSHLFAHRGQPPDDIMLAGCDLVIMSNRSHCWTMARFSDRWVNLESGKDVTKPVETITGLLNSGGVPILLWDRLNI